MPSVSLPQVSNEKLDHATRHRGNIGQKRFWCEKDLSPQTCCHPQHSDAAASGAENLKHSGKLTLGEVCCHDHWHCLPVCHPGAFPRELSLACLSAAQTQLALKQLFPPNALNVFPRPQFLSHTTIRWRTSSRHSW